MSSVKPLPKSIHSVMRSGLLFYDLTSVVEGLVLNSLDSGAKTVSIFIGIGAFSIKVVDDGSGISRDDLALLGERYATSKYHKTDTEDACPRIFGSRGEALASISDIAVLEIISKAHGRPYGYRKVLKGCKCLHLGIDADRKDMGTTVVVRDLFYNQPIRQKSILSSPKKVLESVKRCVLLIAFVHPQISFKVVDIDSDNQLLSTLSSSTPLPLVRNQYGSELCRSLYELNAQDGSLKLEGYLSGPKKGVAIKAFQHLYINSRPICKGPIHKLVNQIASMFDSVEIPTDSDGLQHGKRNRASSCVAFLLNLICPRSQYDLIFEPSKTYAEFKDWDPVFAFIEKTIKCSWKENISEACNPQEDVVLKEGRNSISAMTVEECQESSKFFKKKSKLANSHHRFHDLPSSLDVTSKECNWLSKHGLEEERPKICKKSIEDSYVGRDESRYLQCPFEFDIDKCRSSESLNCDTHSEYWWSPDNGSQCNHGSSYTDYNMLATDHIVNKHSSDEEVDCDAGYHWSTEYTMQFNHTKPYVGGNQQERIWSPERTERRDLRGSLFGWTEQYESRKFDSFVHNTSDMTLTSDHQQQRNIFSIGSGGWRPFKSCSLQGYAEENEMNIRSNEEYSWKTHGHNVRKKNSSIDDGINVKEDDESNWNFGSFSGPLCQDEACSTSAQPDTDMLLETNFISAPLVSSLPSSTERLADETCFTSDSLPHRFPSSSFKWCPDIDILKEPEEYGQICDDGRIFESGTRWDSHHHIYNEYHKYARNINAKMPRKRKSISSFSKVGNNGENHASHFKHSRRQWIEEDFLLENSSKGILSDDRMSSWDSHHRQRTSRENNNSRDAFCSEVSGNVQIHQERTTRSLSAPPFYRKKTRLIFSNAFFTSKLKKFVAEAGKQNHSEKVFSRNHSSFGQRATGHLPIKFRVDATCKMEHDIDMEKISAGGPMTFHESRDYVTKSRDSYVLDTNRNSILVKSTHRSQILSTSSGILHLASDFLVPKSITRDCLTLAQVLQQIDKKFIPIVAGQTLAVIDQHAADERIRLEELRKKVWSGKVKEVTYLVSEKELVLPEMAHQMLHNYKDQVESWGWICSIHTENSVSFQKNFTLIKGWPTVVTLQAVPCILGVDLTDGDLLEFLQQLAETDGSSIMPPSVLRVLNFKACRGAIMFGDSLLPSECSLLVEELKKTKLCFQCAHGRPTTIPLVNLDELHKQVRTFSMLDDRPNHPWHGLCRHEINLKRATDRLHAALR